MRFKIEVKNESGREYFTITLYKGKQPTPESPSVNVNWDSDASKSAIAHMLESSMNNLLHYMATHPAAE